MSTRTAVYRTPLDTPQSFSLRGRGQHPREAAENEYLYLERQFDDAGNETRSVQHEPDGRVRYRKETRWEDGRRTAEKEFFAETGATVIHEIARAGDTETERLLFDGELESTIERTFHPDGTLAVEEVLDAAGDLVSVTERNEAGRLIRQEDLKTELRFSYNADGEIAEVVAIEDGEETVETTVFEAGRPVGALISSGGQEVGRRTVTREGRRRTEEETRGGETVLRRVEDFDPHDRPVTLEESMMRADGSVVETRREQEWLTDGRLAQGTTVGWITVPGAGRMRTTNGRREISYDARGRVAEVLLQDTHDDELEDNSYYRFEYGPET